MKVNELFEAYTPPVKNKKLGFLERAPKAKQGIPTGGTKEWLKTFGATSVDIDQALRVIRQSDVIRKLKALGMTEVGTDRADKNGTLILVGKIKDVTFGGKPTEYRVKFSVQANGKIDEAGARDKNRKPVLSPKPRIVPGDAVQSIVKTMTASLEKLVTTVERRQKDGERKIKLVS